MAHPTQNQSPQFPTEALEKILQHVCADHPVRLPLHQSDPRRQLSLVCREWWKAVQLTRALWTNIHFTGPPAPFHALGPQPLLRQFHTCIRRSQHSLLSVRFDMVLDGWNFSLVEAVILPNIQRIRVLICPVYGYGEIYRFLTIAEGRFQSLEYLDVCFINSLAHPMSVFPLDIYERFSAVRNAPRLRSVTARLLNNLHPFHLHLPFGQLTTLDFGTAAIAPRLCVQILKSTPYLVDGFFYVRFTRFTDCRRLLSKSKVAMKNLQTLRLRLAYPSEDKRLFSALRFPVLQHAWVELYDRYQVWDLPMYMKLLRASSESLKVLHFSDFIPTQTNINYPVRYRHRETSHQALDNFFRLFSRIEKLRLPLGISVHAVTVDKIGTCELLPQLYTLEHATLNGMHVLGMVQQRHAHASNTPLGTPGTSTSVDVVSSRPSDKSYANTLLSTIKFVHIIIPQYGYCQDEITALIQEARALKLLRIHCCIDTSMFLPLPLRKGM